MSQALHGYKTLYLVRHGEAKPSHEDPGRGLSDEGRRAVERLAAWIAATGADVDDVRHSGKLRAAQTAEILAQSLRSPVKPSAVSGLDPNDAVQPVAASVEGSAAAQPTNVPTFQITRTSTATTPNSRSPRWATWWPMARDLSFSHWGS